MGISGGPNVIQDGLVLALDAADRNSYPGSGATWTDLSGNSNTGTLISSPTLNSANGGNFAFNGTTQYVNCGNNSSLQITVGTISAWVRATSPGASFRSIIAKQGAWGLFFNNSILVSYDWGVDLTRTTGLNIADGTWKNTVMTFTQTVGTPSNNAIIYLNGASVLTTTIRNSTQTNNLQIAGATIDSTQILNGNIANAQVYNRVLTAAEIAQNYNSLKTRFDLK